MVVALLYLQLMEQMDQLFQIILTEHLLLLPQVVLVALPSESFISMQFLKLIKK